MLKRWLIGLSVFILLTLVIVSWFFIPHYLNKQLPYLLNGKNTTPFIISYKNADMSLIGNTLIIDEITAIPHNSTSDSTQHDGFFIHIKQLRLHGLNRLKLLKGEEILGNSLEIIEPEVLWYNPPADQRASAEVAETNLKQPLQQLFKLNSLRIINGKFHIKTKSTDKHTKLSVHGIQFTAKNLNVSQHTVNEAIPAAVHHYEFTADSTRYRPEGFFQLSSGKVKLTPEKIQLDQIKYYSLLSPTAYTKQLSTERDWYDIQVAQLQIYRWKYARDTSKVKIAIADLALQQINAQIYRDKRVADDYRVKPLYNELLRKLPFDLTIDTLRIANSQIKYSEQISENGAGDLVFSNFKLKATGVASRIDSHKRQWVDMHIHAQFMDVAPTHVHWRFDIADRLDGFTMQGSIQQLPLANLRPFIKPYMNIEADGKIKKVGFNLFGTNNGAKGDFIVEYEDLKVKVFKQDDRKKQNKLMSFVTNLVVKNEKEAADAKQVKVDVEREKHKSFFNLFWKSLADGLKKSMLINPLGIVYEKEGKEKK